MMRVRRMAPGDDVSQVRCGQPALDDWARERAPRAEALGDAAVFVLEDGDRIVGYYTLSPFSVIRGASPGRVSRNAPDPVPCLLLGRLAVDQGFQGLGLGKALLKDAILEAATVRARIGGRALVCDPLNDEVRAWYLSAGFIEGRGTRKLFFPLKGIAGKG